MCKVQQQQVKSEEWRGGRSGWRWVFGGSSTRDFGFCLSVCLSLVSLCFSLYVLAGEKWPMNYIEPCLKSSAAAAPSAVHSHMFLLLLYLFNYLHHRKSVFKGETTAYVHKVLKTTCAVLMTPFLNTYKMLRL